MRFSCGIFDNVERSRVKLKFGMKMIEKNFPFCFVLLLKKKIVLATSSLWSSNMEVKVGEIKQWRS